MAILNFTGFELGSTADQVLNEFDNSGGTWSIQSTTKRTGTYALRANPTTTAVGYVQIRSHAATGLKGAFSAANLFITFYFRYATKPAATSEEIFLANNGTDLLAIRIDSEGKLSLYNATTQIGSTGTTVLSANTWYRIELNLNDTANTQELKIDGTVEISGTGTTAASWTSFRLGKATNRNGQTVDFFYDDVCVSDSAYPGAGVARLAIPIGAGAAAGWTNGTGTTFAEVDEIAPESDGADATYIQASATQDNQDHTFDMQTWATIGGVGTIKAVKTMVIAKTGSVSNTSTVGLRSLINGSANEATGLELLTTYQMLGKIFETDWSASGVITSADFDSIEVGMFADTIAQTQRFTWAGLGVWEDAVASSATATIVSSLDEITAALNAYMASSPNIVSAVDEIIATLSVNQSQLVTVGSELDEIICSLSVNQSYPVTIVSNLDEISAALNAYEASSPNIVASVDEATADLSANQSYPFTIVSALDEAEASLNAYMASSPNIVSSVDEATSDLSVNQTQLTTIVSSADEIEASLNVLQSYLLTISSSADEAEATLNAYMASGPNLIATTDEITADLNVTQSLLTTIVAALDEADSSLNVYEAAGPNITSAIDEAETSLSVSQSQLVTIEAMLDEISAALQVDMYPLITIASMLAEASASLSVEHTDAVVPPAPAPPNKGRLPQQLAARPAIDLAEIQIPIRLRPVHIDDPQPVLAYLFAEAILRAAMRLQGDALAHLTSSASALHRSRPLSATRAVASLHAEGQRPTLYELVMLRQTVADQQTKMRQREDEWLLLGE